MEKQADKKSHVVTEIQKEKEREREEGEKREIATFAALRIHIARYTASVKSYCIPYFIQYLLRII